MSQKWLQRSMLEYLPLFHLHTFISLLGHTMRKTRWTLSLERAMSQKWLQRRMLDYLPLFAFWQLFLRSRTAASFSIEVETRLNANEPHEQFELLLSVFDLATSTLLYLWKKFQAWKDHFQEKLVPFLSFDIITDLIQLWEIQLNAEAALWDIFKRWRKCFRPYCSCFAFTTTDFSN